MSLLAAVQPERAPNGDFGGRSFQGVNGPPSAMRATAPGFPGAPNVPGSQIGTPGTLRDTPGRRSDATVQYTCVVPMGGPIERAETEGLRAGTLAFVYNDTGLEARGRMGPDKMTRLVSYDHLAAHVTGPKVPDGLTADQINQAMQTKQMRGYVDDVQVIEVRSDFQHLPLPPAVAQFLAVPLDNNAQDINSFLKSPFLMWKARPFYAAGVGRDGVNVDVDGMATVAWDNWNERVLDADGNPILLPTPFDELGMQGVPRDPFSDLDAMRADGFPNLQGSDSYAAGLEANREEGARVVARARAGDLQVEPYADDEEQGPHAAYRTLVYNPLFDEDDGADRHVYKPHGVVIYKYSTQGSDTPAEQVLDAMQNGIFNLCVMGHTLSASFNQFATAARNSSKRQRRLVTLPRDIMYIVVVGRFNPESLGVPGLEGNAPCIDHIRYERTTSEEFTAKMRYRMCINKANSFLRANEVILGAWRLGSVIDNAASRMMPAGSPHSFSGLASNGVTLSVGINWVSSFELHEKYWVPPSDDNYAEDDIGSFAMGVPPSESAAAYREAVNRVQQKEMERRASEFQKEIMAAADVRRRAEEAAARERARARA